MSAPETTPQEKPWKDGPTSVTTGYVGWLTEEQEKMLAEMKAKLEETNVKWEDDYELLRFLRARKFVLADAVDMITKYKHWYAENHVSKYPKEFPLKAACLGDLVPSAYAGFDREGHPVQIECTGRIDVPTLLSAASDQAILLGWIWGQEYQIARCKEACEKFNRPAGSIERFTQIMDLEGLGMSHFQMSKFLTSISKCGEANYPERMARTLIVNYGMTFSILWGMVKFTLDPVTREKVVPCSDFAELHKYVDPSQLPKRYGGTQEDPEGLRERDTVALRKKYLNDDKFKEVYQDVVIQKGETKKIEVDVVNGHEVTYCWRSNEAVQFTATFIPTDTTEEHIIVSNQTKVDATEWPQLGSFQITNDKPGKLVCEFHNDNWWGEKTIKFATLDIDLAQQAAEHAAEVAAEAAKKAAE